MGQPVNIDPIAAMLNPASLHENIHMVLAAYVATAFLVAGIHAFFLLRDHKASFTALPVVLRWSLPVFDSAPDGEAEILPRGKLPS